MDRHAVFMSSTPAHHSSLADYRTNHRMLVLAALAVPVGVISAFVAKALLWLINTITNLAFFHRFSSESVSLQHHQMGPWIVAVLMFGALVIGLMARYGSEKIRGHGIPEALEAILLGRSVIKLKVAILKPISSAISIGTGGPFGAEGPIIMTGGAFGSILAQFFHLTAAERKTLLVAGAAAGMSAVFATPIAAVLLAVELLLFEWKPRSLVPTAVAALVASAMRVPLLGTGPIFPVAAHAPVGYHELLIAAVVGIAVGLASGGLTHLVYLLEDAFAKLPIHWMWWPCVGAFFVGIGGLVDPRVLGVGYDLIDGMLKGEIIGAALLGLLVGKALVWAIALGSGTSGGVLAPLLIIGGALGAWLGGLMPGHDSALWAAVGMAAMMGGTMRSPFTGMIFLLELTHDLHSLPVLFSGSIVAYAVTVLLLPRSILTEKLARRGQHIAREYSVDLFEMMRVGDVMDREAPVIPASTPLREFSARVASGDPAVSRRQGTLLVDGEEKLVGIITRGDVVRALEKRPGENPTVLEAGRSELVVTYPDETLHDAIAKMLKHDHGRLPVVERAHAGKIVGYLGRAGIIAARERYHREEEVRERGLGLGGDAE
jgi:H+/Cl- antiporter ClcA/predicted transcriptional regulator